MSDETQDPEVLTDPSEIREAMDDTIDPEVLDIPEAIKHAVKDQGRVTVRVLVPSPYGREGSVVEVEEGPRLASALRRGLVERA